MHIRKYNLMTSLVLVLFRFPHCSKIIHRALKNQETIVLITQILTKTGGHEISPPFQRKPSEKSLVFLYTLVECSTLSRLC